MSDNQNRIPSFDEVMKKGSPRIPSFEDIMGTPAVEKKSKVGGSAMASASVGIGKDGLLPSSVNEPENPFSLDRYFKKEEPEQGKYVKSLPPKTIQEGVVKDKKKDDSVIGGVFNTIVGSVARIGGGITSLHETLIEAGDDINDWAMGTPGFSKVVRKHDPTGVLKTPERQEVVNFIEKARTSSSSKANEQARSQFDITNGVQSSDVKALLFSAPSVLLDMTAGATTGGTSFFLQSVNDNAAELEKIPESKNLTSTEKLGYVFVQGTVQAALEKFGLDKILKATGVSAKLKNKISAEVTNEFIKKGVKATAKDIENAVLKKVSSMPNEIKRLGVKAATGFGVEATTEGAQSALSDGIKLLTNRTAGNAPFDEEDITANFLKNIINAGAQGGVFGGVGSVGVGVMQNTNKAIREQIAKSQTPEDIEKIRMDIAEQVELGNITQEEANAANITANQYAKIAAKIPYEIEAEKKYAIIGGIEQREGLKKEIESVKKGLENLDPAFHEDSKARVQLLEAKLEQTNDYLEGVIAGKNPTYRKEKPTTEGGEEKYYKTSPSGEETKITKEHYDLAIAVREEQAAKNKAKKEEVKEINPEEVIIEQAKAGKLAGGYSELVQQQPSLAKDVLLDYAKQKYGLGDDGSVREGGGREITNKEVDAAVTKAFPTKEAVIAKINEATIVTEPLEKPKEGTAENVVPSTSVIMPGEIKQPETITIKPKEDAVSKQEPDAVDVRQQASYGEGVGKGDIQPQSTTTKEEGKGTGETPPIDTKGTVFVERPGTELSFRGLQNVANEFGYENVKSRDRVSDIKEKQNAREIALDWAEKGEYQKNINDLLSKIASRELVPTAKQRLILQEYLANESQKLRELKSSPEEYNAQFEKVKQIKEIGQIARQEAGAGLRIPVGGQSHPVADYADAAVTMAQSVGKEVLTETQKAEVDKLVSNYEEKARVAEEKVAELEAKLSEMEASKEIKKQSGQRKKKTAQEYKDERAKFREELKAAKEEHEKWLKDQGIKTAGIGITLTPKMIKAIGKMAGSYASELGDNIAAITKKVYEEVKDFFTDITEQDITDIISGKYGDDYNRLWQIKQNLEKGTVDLKEKISNEDFEKIKKITWVQNKELKAKYPKLYKEALDALDAKEQAKIDYDIAVQKAELAKRGAIKKYADWGRAIIATTKAIKSGIDDSAIMMQNAVAMVAHPRSGALALKEHTLDALSEKRFRRYLTELHNSPLWELMQQSGLDITDPRALREGNKEEIFDNNLLNRDIVIRKKKYNVGKYVTKPFERAFTSLGNAMRVNMFTKIAQRMLDEGKTFETHPEEFKSLAKVLNTETGRGKVHEQVERASKLVTAGIWSPKLMASRLNMLGLGDVGNALIGGKGYYASLTPEMRKMAAIDMAKFIGAGVALMGFAGWLGADVDWNPESPKFGTITIGNKTYNGWGGFSTYVRTIVQASTGRKMKGEERVKANRGETLLKFFRGKLTPAAGVTTNLLMGKDYRGKPTTATSELMNLVAPISVTAVAEALQKDGTLGLITEGLPSFIGIGVTDQRDFEKTSSGKATKQGKSTEKKPTKAD